MTPLRRRAYLACALTIGTCLCFFLTELTPLPVLLYHPVARRFTLGQPATALAPPGPAMDYYGRSLLALLGGAAAGLLVLLSLRVAAARAAGRAAAGTEDPPGRPLLLLCTAWAATAFVLCASLYAYKLSGRELTPEPLPAWYQPR